MRTSDYTPTPAEIRRACAEIRATWSPSEFRKRASGAKSLNKTLLHWIAPEYSLRELAMIGRQHVETN